MRAPNLLFIITDQQRFDTLAAYGNHRIKMPFLNRLASQSYVFEKAYVTQPVCSPSRSSILTGTYPHWNGVTENDIPLKPGVTVLPEMITKGDYFKGYLGRTGHLMDADRVPSPVLGLQERKIYSMPPDDYLIENGIMPIDGKSYTKTDRAHLPEPFCGPAYLAEDSSRFIRENREHPFVLFSSIYEPHDPLWGPFNDLHDPAEVALPDNFSAVPTADQPLKTRLEQQCVYEREHGNSPLRTEQDWRKIIARYWGLCSLVDKYIGKILNTIEECGLWDNTIIVFTSDHGDMMGSHRLLGKNVMFEESVRVPLLIRLPGQKTSRKISNPVSLIDLVPTLLDLLGQNIPGHLQGKSLKPVLEDTGNTSDDVFVQWTGVNYIVTQDLSEEPIPDYLAKITTREEAMAALGDVVRSIVTHDGWKFNWSQRGEHELYNLNEDPGETTNLVVRKDSLPLMRELAERIRRWQQRTGDALELPLP